MTVASAEHIQRLQLNMIQASQWPTEHKMLFNGGEFSDIGLEEASGVL